MVIWRKDNKKKRLRKIIVLQFGAISQKSWDCAKLSNTFGVLGNTSGVF